MRKEQSIERIQGGDERAAGAISLRLMGVAASALGGLCLAQGAAASGLLPLPEPLLEASTRLSEAGLLAGPLGLCALTLIGVQRCLSATVRSQRQGQQGRAQQGQVLAALETQAEQLQHVHVSTLGLERGLLENMTQGQTLVDRKLEGQRQALERLQVALVGVEQRLGEPRPSEVALRQELKQLELRLAELGEKLATGLAGLEHNLSDGLVQASDTISRWLSREELDLSGSLEQGSVTRYEHASHGDSDDLEQALAALPKTLGRLEIPDDYELLELPDGEQGQHRPRLELSSELPLSTEAGDDSWLDGVEEEQQAIAPRPGFNSAPLIAPQEAAALAQTGFHKVQSLGFLDGMVEPSHPELAGVQPETPPVYDLDGPGAALPGRSRAASRQAHPQGQD